MLFIRLQDRQLYLFNDDFKCSLIYPCLRRIFESHIALRIKHQYVEQAWAYHISCDIKTPSMGEDGILLLRNRLFVIYGN